MAMESGTHDVVSRDKDFAFVLFDFLAVVPVPKLGPGVQLAELPLVSPSHPRDVCGPAMLVSSDDRTGGQHRQMREPTDVQGQPIEACRQVFSASELSSVSFRYGDALIPRLPRAVVAQADAECTTFYLK